MPRANLLHWLEHPKAGEHTKLVLCMSPLNIAPPNVGSPEKCSLTYQGGGGEMEQNRVFAPQPARSALEHFFKGSLTEDSGGYEIAGLTNHLGPAKCGRFGNPGKWNQRLKPAVSWNKGPVLFGCLGLKGIACAALLRLPVQGKHQGTIYSGCFGAQLFSDPGKKGNPFSGRQF